MAHQVHGSASSATSITYNKNSYENTRIFDKTRRCKFYAKGKCKRGQACTFAHGDGEVQPQPDFFRTQLCADFVRSGACKSGSGCSYAHSPQELRQPRTNKNSRGRGLSKSVAPPASLEVNSVKIMQREVACVRSEPPALQTVTGRQVPGQTIVFGRSTLPACKAKGDWSLELVDEQDLEDIDWLDVSSGVNCQNKEDGNEPPQRLSSQSTFEDGDTWGDLDSVPCSMYEADMHISEAEVEEAIPCELFMKRTFMSLEPVKAVSCRRARSAPAARWHGFV